jgi:ankyrin repeat protein
VQDTATNRLDAMEGQDNVGAVTPRLSPSSTGLLADADGVKSTAASTPNGIRSSPPAMVKDVAMDLDLSNASPEDTGVKSDSEAETIVLPGKDGHSPSKIRKSIKHEDKSDDEEGISNAPDVGSVDSGEAANKAGLEDGNESGLATSTLGKRKRVKHVNNKDESANLGNSSGLSSVPTSPVATTRSSLSKPAASDSDISRSPSPRSPSSTVRDKAKSVDRVLPRRKQYGSRSGDEGESRRHARQRSSGGDHRQGREKDNRGSSKQNLDSRKRTRSISPPTRSHRRSISSQLPSKSIHGLSHKKKRVPAPLQSTEYQSDESSASGSSSHPRSSRLHNLTAPVTGESTISPAKMAPHKKHVNSSGQTWLARACAAGKLEVAKQRLEERPEDLNVADNAMNTPLHTASIDGHEDIVKLLLDSGCVVDPVNVARDTPLHDAIENGHVDVVKLLLDAGANPRKANGKGEDPYDLVNDNNGDLVAEEMRDAIIAAKERSNDVRRSSEDEQMHDLDSRMSHTKESPRQTPPAHDSQFFSSTSRRNAGTRSVKTSDRILYQRLDSSELRKAAAENDMDSIVRILEVHSSHLDDPKSLVIAAKAGHHEAISYMLALGSFNPDPQPLKDMPADSATPILAAIGRDNLQVIELFLNQSNFDPTRLVNGETYYDIAKKRGGHFWKDEEAILKKAFDKYKTEHQSPPRKPRSPGLRRDGRDLDRDTRKTPRRDEQQTSRSHKRTTSSPQMKDPEPSKAQHRSTHLSSLPKESQNIVKRGPGRPRKEEAAVSEAVSDRETTPLGPPKQKSQAKRSESDIAVASESETANKPRRKLVSGKEFRGERELEKQRRASIASNASTASVKERREGESKADRLARKTSPNVPRISKTNHIDQELTSEQSNSEKDKQRTIKRDDSKDRLSAIRGENPVKRPRKSATPPRPGLQEVSGYDSGEVPQKRRKLEGESKAARKAEGASSSSSDQRVSTAKDVNDRVSTKSSSDPKDKARSNHKLIDSPDSSRHASEEPSKKPSEKAAKAPKPTGEAVEREVAVEESEAAAAKAEEQREAQNRREKEEQEAKEKTDKFAREKKLEEERIEEMARQARLAREQVERDEEAKRKQEAERKERQRQEDAEAQ